MLRLLALLCVTLASSLAAPVPVGRCVANCLGVADGDYHSCNGCDVYATCSNGLLYDNRACPANLVWDDRRKRCEYRSATCKPACRNANCVSDCSKTRNGDYQSCNGCSVYVTCSNGLTYDNRPCPASLVWDDKAKRCEYKSTTCRCRGNSGNSKRGEVVRSEGAGACVSDCSGLDDGDYQSCNGCNVFVTCSNGLTYDDRPCPMGLVWDDSAKRCEYRSSTCKIGGASCVSDCAGLQNGDYQSCAGCDVFATCSNENLVDNRPCPANLVWDDIYRRCEYASRTCRASGGDGNNKRENVDINGESAGSCVSDCTGMNNGDYQSCNGCDVFVTCSNEITNDDRPCPMGLVWDDNVKRCEYRSSTCKIGGARCVSDCAGLQDGDYQSCLGCSVFATCSNQQLYDSRACPPNLVWDDIFRRCEYSSRTCRRASP